MMVSSISPRLHIPLPRPRAAEVKPDVVLLSGEAWRLRDGIYVLDEAEKLERAAALAPAGPAGLIAAILPDGRRVPPDHWHGGYHGTKTSPDQVLKRQGFPARGNDWRLLEHVLQVGNSAFRGTTHLPADIVTANGAAAWAGDGGWVYEIRNLPSWDVNVQLEGRVPKPSGYGNNPVYGENETAIPARVPLQNIARWGQVCTDHVGILYVPQWHDNPAYDPHSFWKPLVADGLPQPYQLPAAEE